MFLEDMQEFYELIIYTSAERRYANSILDFIEKRQQYFAHRLYYPQCVVKKGQYSCKDLEIFCHNRNLNNVVIVDNLVSNYCMHIKNGIPILYYKGSDVDTQLIHLASYLRTLAEAKNISVVIKNDFTTSLSINESIKGLC